MKFFNNVVSVMTSEEEKIESLKAIADTVGVAMEAQDLAPDMWFGTLEKKRSKSSTMTLNPVDMLSMRRDKSPSKLRSVGSKALSNVTSQFSRLNPISRLKRNTPKEFTDIRQEELDIGNEAFEEDFDEDLKYLNSLHLPSSGLLMNSEAGSGEEGVSLNVQSSSISFTKTQSHSNSQLNSSPSPSNDQSNSHLVPGERTRKLSKSTEDIPAPKSASNHLDSMFVPFSKFTKGLQSIGSNIDSKLGNQEASAAAYQYVSPQQQPQEKPSPNSNVRTYHMMSADVEAKIRNSGSNSFILFI